MKVLNDITDFVFVEDKPCKADIIFIPGSAHPHMAEKAAELFLQGYAPYIMPSGKHALSLDRFPGPSSKADIYNGDYRTECEFMADVMIKAGVDPKAVIWEDNATTTIENAFCSKKLIDSMGLVIKKAIICSKSFHARRSLMCYSWALPEVDFLVCPIDTPNATREDWFRNEEGINTVMSEMSLIGRTLKEAVKVWDK